MKYLCPLCRSISELKNLRDSYKYYLCKMCETLFLHPQPSKKHLEKYYKSNFQYCAGSTNEKIIRRRAQIILKKLIYLNSQGSRLLDIGSGYGYFLDEASKVGLNVTGIEPNKSLADQSINSVKNTTFEKFFIKNKKYKYDFVTLIHVIEHIPNPKKMIQMACELLAPGGILYIETPNLDSHLYRAENDNYTFLTPPDHLWIFSKKSFLKILDRDYEINRASTYSYPEHFMGVLKAITKSHWQPARLPKGGQDNPQGPKKKQFIDISYWKYLLFDKYIARLFYPLLNLKYYGSILELYIKKK